MIYLQLLQYFLGIIVVTLHEQLAVRLCLTASLTTAFTEKEQRHCHCQKIVYHSTWAYQSNCNTKIC